jgi:hypothetical protein
MSPYDRPPVGFVVEGYGEFYSYPSLVCRVLDVNGIKVPCSKAPSGCGQVFDNLIVELENLVKVDHPYAVIVTVDYVDLRNRVNNCREAVEHLQTTANDWLNRMRTQGRFLPLPEHIRVVLQMKKFESWLASDEQGLADSGLLIEGYTPKIYKNTDDDIGNPYPHLKTILSNLDPKKPRDAKKIVTALNVGKVEAQSRSFRKFAQEVRDTYRLWEEACAFHLAA